MDINNIYKQLTNVDIEQQKQLWDERGKGYYGEYLLFCELYKNIPGNGKILMNLNIPVDESKTTEIDLLLIHETVLYVFEIKHYKGTIYGKDTDAIWTQYFRTVKNNTFKNPIEQNRYHITALRKLFPNVPIHSCIVFTSPNCNIKVTKSNDMVDICRLYNVCRVLSNRFSKGVLGFSAENIDKVFIQLSKYSQMQENVTIGGKEASFSEWVQPVIYNLETKKNEVEQIRKVFLENTEKLKKTRRTCIITSIVVTSIICVMSILIVIGVSYYANNEISELKKSFLYAADVDQDYVDIANSIVEVTNVSFASMSDGSISFTARLYIEDDTYGIALTDKSKYMVTTTDGKTMEYDVFGEHLKYNRSGNMLGKGIKSYGNLARTQFNDISNENEILQIKLTGIELFKLDDRSFAVKDNLEIELYSK